MKFTPLHIVVDGKPVAWARAGLKGKKHFTPAHTANWKYIAGLIARSQMKNQEPLAGCALLSVRAYFPVPRSWPGWKKALALTGALRHTTKPDTDNLVKITKDALTGAAVWVDDAYVVELEAGKYYATKPRIEITVSEMSCYPSQITRNPESARKATV